MSSTIHLPTTSQTDKDIAKIRQNLTQQEVTEILKRQSERPVHFFQGKDDKKRFAINFDKPISTPTFKLYQRNQPDLNPSFRGNKWLRQSSQSITHPP